MDKVRYVFWQDGEIWLGYLADYPDYRTQGENLDDLKEHLVDLHGDLTGGLVPCIRRVAELELS